MSATHVITGATGLIGSHVAEQLVALGRRVRAFVRPNSDTRFLQSLGIELSVGQFNEPQTLRRALDGAEVVYHCAARVSDWGPWLEYQNSIDATGLFLEGCRIVGVPRVLYVSSITVYGNPKLAPGEQITEDYPLTERRWRGDYYAMSKVRTEFLCQRYPGPLTIVRPAWVYGPRDRNSLPRVIKAIQAGRAALVGTGENLLNLVHAADVANGIIAAAAHPEAAGKAYNLCSEGQIPQREYFRIITDALGRKPLRRRFPYWLAFQGGAFAEFIGWVIGLRRAPHITRHNVDLMGRSTRYSIVRARNELGWTPTIAPQEGLRAALAWYFNQ